MKKSLQLLLFKPVSSGATYLIKNETIKSALTLFCVGWITVRGLYLINGIHVKAWQSIHISYLDTFVGFNLSSYLIDFTYRLFLSILIAFICWIVMRIWVKVDFLKVFMVTLVVNVNIRMHNFDDAQCTIIPSVAYGLVTGMNLQLC